MFRDRVDAGRQLAKCLEHYREADAVVLGVPRGGVVTAAEVSRVLDLPMDVVVARKIGAPGNEEFAVGAIDEDGEVVRNPDVRVPESYLQRACREQRDEIARRLVAYREGRAELRLEGRLVIVVDDGIATGLTALSAVRFVRRRGAARVVLAVPVISREASVTLSGEVDELVAVEIPHAFYAVGAFYEYFPQTGDDEVKVLLGGAAERAGAGPVGM
jgi:putative phosphoribosyl transferase